MALTPAAFPTAGIEVVTDASLWLHAALPMHSYHAQALAFVTHCVTIKAVMIAPPLWESEVDGSIRRAHAMGQIDAKAMHAAFAFVDAAPVTIMQLPETRQRARILADAIGQPRVYDATYLALAQARGCEMWTADQRLFNAAQGARLAWVKFIGA